MTQRSGAKGKVLVVDDEPAQVRLMLARLGALGYEAVGAAGGAEALRLLAEQPVDLVLTDMRMPGMDGAELVRRIRADPTLGGLPVVLLSGFDGPEERAIGLDAGADDFLTKPVQLAELQLRVHAQVRLHRLNRELRHRGQVLGGDAALPSEQDVVGRVFVLEDDPQWSRLLVEPLSLAGHRVETASDLRSGVAAIARFEPDVLLVDLKLPDGDGTEVIRRFHHVGTGRATPVIVVMTAAGDDAEKVACLELGADDFVAKPVSPAELLARVASQMRRLRAAEHAARQVQRALGNAYTDGLTGVYNRRYFDEDLVRRVRAATERGEGFALVLADVDHFKRVNDTWGHAAGDAVLRDVALQIRRHLRTGDLECRYGGEEFVVVLPATSLGDARLVAERLRAGIAAGCRLPDPADRVTASFGVAAWIPGESAALLFERADGALYAAKRGGRDRVELAASPELPAP